MRDVLRGLVIFMVCVVGAWAVHRGEAKAQGFIGNDWYTAPDGVICNSYLGHVSTPVNKDAKPLICGTGKTFGDYSRVMVDNSGSATAVYVCGNNAGTDGGPSAAQAPTSCTKICNDSATCKFSTFTVSVKKAGSGKCWSAGAFDAGVKVVVHCLK